MITLQAEFIGKQVSRGYIPKKIYTLKLQGDWMSPISEKLEPLPYTVEGFLVNWRVIKII